MVKIYEVDFSNQQHCDAVIELMNHYMQDPMGDAQPHNEESAVRLIEGLHKHSNKLCLLAEQDGEFIGLTNCFIGFGTFAAKPFINIHDIVVKNSVRGKGVGRLLLKRIKEMGEEMGCCKVTLEVRADNKLAQHLYSDMGFKEENPPMHFWVKKL